MYIYMYVLAIYLLICQCVGIYVVSSAHVILLSNQNKKKKEEKIEKDKFTDLYREYLDLIEVAPVWQPLSIFVWY